ncbi:MAG: hypothetical protein EXS36_04490 [Pedosphaera sp.]|nr:hypothetical protein [Pedosphaera sp.]
MSADPQRVEAPFAEAAGLPDAARRAAYLDDRCAGDEALRREVESLLAHRDLKPSNVLVTVNDGVPVPKVIDFGIAKATDQQLTDNTIFTRFAQFLGTPAYMSPEQAEFTNLDIDTRSDIYSLGVLLYELLTGKTPSTRRNSSRPASTNCAG